MNPMEQPWQAVLQHDNRRLVTVRGDAREVGEAQGRSLAGVWSAALDHLARAVGSTATRHLIRPAFGPVLNLVGAAYFRRDRDVLARHSGGRFLHSHRGLAHALGISAAPLYGLAAFEIESAVLPYRLGCTSLAIDACVDGPLLAYNHDFPAALAPFVFLRRSHTAHAYASLSITYPVMVGCIAGINERGLAASVNQAFATDVARARPGLLVTMLVQDVLDRCCTVEMAIERMCATRVTNGSMVTLVDARGSRAVVELSATLAEVRRPSGPVLTTFNAYETGRMRGVEVPPGAITTGLGAGVDVHAPNVARAKRFAELSSVVPTLLDDEAILGWLSDHEGGPGSMNTICAHGGALNETILCALLDPKARRIRIRYGAACGGGELLEVRL